MFLLPYGLVSLALMDRFIYRCPCLWIAPIFQLPVTVEDVITAPLQFFSHRGFARAGDSLNKIITFAHRSIHYLWTTPCFALQHSKNDSAMQLVSRQNSRP